MQMRCAFDDFALMCGPDALELKLHCGAGGKQDSKDHPATARGFPNKYSEFMQA